jgi:hypothetical protein
MKLKAGIKVLYDSGHTENSIARGGVPDAGLEATRSSRSRHARNGMNFIGLSFNGKNSGHR